MARFTLEEIDAIHVRLGNANTLAAYVLALRDLGVECYASYLTDGHSVYVGQCDHMVMSPAAHEILVIAATSDRDALLAHLRQHERGETDYFAMSRGLAESGVKKWTVDTRAMTMTFYDSAGEPLLVEAIAEASGG